MKELLRSAFPKLVADGAYLKALIENEIELRLLPFLCRPDRLSIDIGAFTGLYSTGASYFSAGVIAVEPQRGQADLLRRSMPTSVVVVEAAVSSMTGTGVLKMETAAGGSMSSLDHTPVLPDKVFEVEVPTLRLDDLANEPVGFIKIDVEGHELEALKGARRILEQDRPALLIEAEERNRPDAVKAVSSYLAELGYNGFYVQRGELRPVRELDVAASQDPQLITGGKRNSYADYINNFIFVAGDLAHNIPLHPPTACEAIVSSLARRMKNAIRGSAQSGAGAYKTASNS